MKNFTRERIGFLAIFLSPRVVGAVVAEIRVRSSFSQWVLSRSCDSCEELILTVGAQWELGVM